MVITSADGLTVTLTVAVVDAIPTTELFAVTVKLNTCGAAPAGIFGAVKVCTEPFAAPDFSVMPAGAVQVNVRLPPFGSTPVAFKVTIDAPSPVTGFGVAVALTDGGVPAGGTAIGTVMVVVDGLVVLLPPTVNEKVRFSGAATTGAVKVAVAALALVIVMTGSPGFTICCHWKGPFVGVLPVELRVTIAPAWIGVFVELKLATAFARF
jgi:hypothetical protein